MPALPSVAMRIIPRLSGAAHIRARSVVVTAALSTVLSAALMLTGCVRTSVPDPVSPTPRATPVFANEAEALAAATAAYAAYVKVSDEIFADGGVNPDRLEAVATGKQLKTNIKGFADARSKTYRSSGGTTFDHVALQSYMPSQDDALVTIYVCDDISSVNVTDSLGVSVVSENRPDRAGYQATFARSAKSVNHLLLSDKESWSGLAC
jgi:hypothetical protein